jgi:hypothetical protein
MVMVSKYDVRGIIIIIIHVCFSTNQEKKYCFFGESRKKDMFVFGPIMKAGPPHADILRRRLGGARRRKKGPQHAHAPYCTKINKKSKQ